MGDDSDEQLEQRVEQVEQQLSKMLPGRRGVLKGLGAAAIGGAAVGASSGGAAGQSAAGQIGTSSEPVDVKAASVGAQSVNTEVSRTKEEPAANVKAYGAEGDGSTNDTAAIEDALNAANRIYFPAGTYIVDPTILIGSETEIFGDGEEQSTIKIKDGADADNRVFWADGSSGSEITDVYIHDLTLDGNRQNLGGSTGPEDEAISFNYVDNFTVERVRAINCGNDGFDFDNCSNGLVYDCDAIDNGGSGIHVTDNSSDVDVAFCYANNNGAEDPNVHNGIDAMSAGENVRFIACTAENQQSGGDGFDTNSSGTVFTDCTARNNAGAGFNSTVDATFKSPTATDNGASGVITGPNSTVLNPTCLRNDGGGINGDDGAHVIGGELNDNNSSGLSTFESVLVEGTTANNNSAGDGSADGFEIRGADSVLKDVSGTGNGRDDVRILAPDVRVEDIDVDNFAWDTRTYYDGILGGGPIGGYDIGSLTGASEGDRARADGTAGDTDAIYILNSNGDWQALHDPTTTITPA